MSEGFLSDEKLTLLMRDHDRPEAADPVLIGARAVNRGWITPEQADHARIRQKLLRGERVDESDLERMRIYDAQHRARGVKLSQQVMQESERLSRAVRGEGSGLIHIPPELRKK